jgi:beta-xylosidase
MRGFRSSERIVNVDGSLVTLDSSIGQIHDFIYIPTLEELVEACDRDGYFDFSIKHDKAGSKWYA